MAAGKIFGLGLSRSGTTSLNGALEILGYSALHFPDVRFRYGRIGLLWGNRELRLSGRVDRRYDALSDITILPFYRELDVTYPGSKFVLTVREKEAWLGSCSNFRKFKPEFRSPPEILELRRNLYGNEYFDRDAYSAAYDRHHHDVQTYFRDREDDLLVLDICSGEGWDLLCPFLGREVPAEPFPWQNKRKQGTA